MHCIICLENVNNQRSLLGYKTCLSCGEKQAKKKKHCIVPLHKSTYFVANNKQQLLYLNKP